MLSLTHIQEAHLESYVYKIITFQLSLVASHAELVMYIHFFYTSAHCNVYILVSV